MSRTIREQFISRALIRVLLSAGGIPVREETLFDRTSMFVGPPQITDAQFAETLRHHDRTMGHLTGIDDENGRLWAINPAGRVWAAQNNL